MASPTSSQTLAICVATYRRPEGLSRLVESLRDQGRGERARAYSLELRVVDNSPEGSAEDQLTALAARLPFPLRSRHEPEPNIARARNAAIELGPAELLVFVDDDEVASEGWLEELLRGFELSQADAVFGTVERVLPDSSPSWIRRGGFFADAQPAAAALGWTETRTGNTLLRGSWCYEEGFRFDEAFGRSGGEDVHFFARLAAAGARFHGAPQAIVSEGVETRRLKLSYLLERGYRQGMILSRVRAEGLRHPLASLLGRVAQGGAVAALGLPLVGLGRPEFVARGLARLALAGGGFRGWIAPHQSSSKPYTESSCASPS